MISRFQDWNPFQYSAAGLGRAQRISTPAKRRARSTAAATEWPLVDADDQGVARGSPRHRGAYRILGQ